MGRPMIKKLLDKGYTVQVYDKYPETAETVISEGAIWRNSPRECAEGMDIVITCLPLPHHVYENMVGEDGAIAGMHPGSVWIDTSTTDYHNTLRIAAIAAGKDIYSLEAPVSNLSHMGVDFANVSFYVGGDKPGFNISEDALNTMGKISFYVGAIGVAQTVKLLTNLLFYTAMVLMGEVLLIARSEGISLHWFWDYTKESIGNSFVTEQVSPFLFDGSYDFSCTLEITVKDTSLTVALADELNVAMPLGRIVEERYRQAGQRYKPFDNHVIVNRLLEEENNTELRLPNFTALSKYGRNRSFVMPEGLIEDEYGRVKPRVLETYTGTETCMDSRLLDVAKRLTLFMAFINWQILGEAYTLGENMGLDRDLLKQVIRWSCGTSYMSEHENAKQFTERALTNVKDLVLDSKCHLPVMTKILATFAGSCN